MRWHRANDMIRATRIDGANKGACLQETAAIANPDWWFRHGILVRFSGVSLVSRIVILDKQIKRKRETNSGKSCVPIDIFPTNCLCHVLLPTPPPNKKKHVATATLPTAVGGHQIAVWDLEHVNGDIVPQNFPVQMVIWQTSCNQLWCMKPHGPGSQPISLMNLHSLINCWWL